MGLSDVYEPICAFLLHRIPLPILEQAISELLSEETHLGLILTSHVEPLLLSLVPELVAPLIVLEVLQPLVLSPLVRSLSIMSVPFVILLIIACLHVLFRFASIVASGA
ncbi:hypothetical protein Acr_10g0004210 [Actinidia rufa]|uniref:Uncharacterized protein n=1 Tax=Actinidia rufa TaxID=165716 RepID=A0A7J0F9D3_9ERIC|nr:hypothetical protein Acr_10g0004210 [Actinidia rufa]